GRRDDRRRVEAVRSDDAQPLRELLPHLDEHLRGGAGEPGCEDRVRALALRLGDEGREIDIGGLVRDGPRDRDPVVGGRLLEDVRTVRRELLVALEHEHDLLEIELVLRRLERGRQSRLLTERRAEDPVARAVVALADDPTAGVRDRDHRKTGLLRDRMRARRDARERRPEDRRDLVLVDELAKDGDALVTGRRVVLDDERDLRAIDPAGCVDLLHRELRAVLLRRSVDVCGAGERDGEANLDVRLRPRRRRWLRTWSAAAARRQQHRGSGGEREQTSPHGAPPLRRDHAMLANVQRFAHRRLAHAGRGSSPSATPKTRPERTPHGERPRPTPSASVPYI